MLPMEPVAAAARTRALSRQFSHAFITLDSQHSTSFSDSMACAAVVLWLAYRPMACIPSSGLLRLTWQQLDSCTVDLGAGWPHTVPQRCSGPALSTATSVYPVVSGVKVGPAAYTNDTVPSPGCVLQGLRPWWP